jgi:hypothetical protein
LRAVKRLYLALLVNRDDNGVLGRIHVETNDVPDYFDEQGIVGALERAHAVGPQSMRFPQTLNGAQAHADGFSHGAAGPVRGLSRRFGAGQLQDPSDDLQGQRRPTGLARLVAQQAIYTLLGVTRLPTPYGGPTDAGAASNFRNGQPLSQGKDDLRALSMLSSAVAIVDDGKQTLTFSASPMEDVDGLGHPPRHAHPHPSVSLPLASVQ